MRPFQGRPGGISGPAVEAMILAVTLLGAVLVAPGRAEVLMGRKEALAAAFPGAARVEQRELFLTREQVERVEAQARCRLDSPLIGFYEAYQGDERLGRAFLETRTIRSLTGTFMTVLDSRGSVAKVLVCAFHEPPDYLPTPRWLARLLGLDAGARLRVGDDVAAVTGATMSAHAVTDSVRRALALDALLLAPAPGDATGKGVD